MLLPEAAREDLLEFLGGSALDEKNLQLVIDKLATIHGRAPSPVMEAH